MPVSPSLAENLAADTVAHYAAAERALLELIARHLARGLDSPDWATDRLAQVQQIRRGIQRIIARLDADASVSVAAAVTTAWGRGGAAAVAELGAAGLGDLPDLPGQAAVDRLVEDTLTRLRGTYLRVARAVDDMYRRIITRVSAQVLLGGATRVQAAQRALDELAGRGITGFVDTAGRSWELASYVEMAVRSTAARAAVDAHSGRLVAAGHDLVIVSDAPQECTLCRPYEGKVLSLTGVSLGREGVAGTLAVARAAGLYHPGCRHSHSLYLPGVTKPMHGTADPDGDRARQQLRYLERQVRAWKRREVVALDDAAGKAARARVRAYQARIRAHVATTTAKRQPRRERIGRAR